jgi:muramoyltetrapeptide carboxypeptidase LdcA involved in peptidoglycan recycling
MNSIFPNSINKGDKITVISPSDCLKSASGTKDLAQKRLETELGIEIVYSANCFDFDTDNSESIAKRSSDLNNVFSDKSIKAIICGTGGFNANEILPFIDWDVVKNNPKVFIGSSDNTVLVNAIYAKTGLVTYYGPNFFKFGMKLGLEYTLDYLKKCLTSKSPFNITPSEKWSNDKWFKDQDNRNFIENKGFLLCNSGTAKGLLIGGNLCSLNLLQSTEYFPTNDGKTILFIEDDDLAGEDTFGEFKRNLTSLMQTPLSKSIGGIVLGRFAVNSQMDNEKIKKFFESNKVFKNIPIIANVDFGHCDPNITFPIGGEITLSVDEEKIDIVVEKH